MCGITTEVDEEEMHDPTGVYRVCTHDLCDTFDGKCCGESECVFCHDV